MRLARAALVILLGGCGSEGIVGDASVAVDAVSSDAVLISADTAMDVAGPDAGTDAAPDLGRADADPSFVAIAPCLEPAHYLSGPTTSVGVDGFRYVPACLKVRAGTTVTIEAGAAHPLGPRAGGSPDNPIIEQTAATPFLFTKPGLYPFHCVEHIDQGMFGVIWVTAE